MGDTVLAAVHPTSCRGRAGARSCSSAGPRSPSVGAGSKRLTSWRILPMTSSPSDEGPRLPASLESTPEHREGKTATTSTTPGAQSLDTGRKPHRSGPGPPSCHDRPGPGCDSVGAREIQWWEWVGHDRGDAPGTAVGRALQAQPHAVGPWWHGRGLGGPRHPSRTGGGGQVHPLPR